MKKTLRYAKLSTVIERAWSIDNYEYDFLLHVILLLVKAV